MIKTDSKEVKKLIIDTIKETLLRETSYNRVRQHIEQGNAFTIITSDRHERSGAENRQFYKLMKQEFAAAGYPFTELKGGFKETTKIEKDPETGEEIEVQLEEPRHVIENSILATTDFRPDVCVENSASDLLAFSAEISKKYKQEAFIFGEAATTASGRKLMDIKAYDKNGVAISEPWAGPWSSVETVQQDADFWSRVKGKYFQLKEEEKKTSQPKSWIEALMKSKKGLKW